MFSSKVCSQMSLLSERVPRNMAEVLTDTGSSTIYTLLGKASPGLELDSKIDLSPPCY